MFYVHAAQYKYEIIYSEQFHTRQLPASIVTVLIIPRD